MVSYSVLTVLMVALQLFLNVLALDLNCTKLNITGTECINYMRQSIEIFITDRSKYNPNSIPVRNPDKRLNVPTYAKVGAENVQVEMDVTFNSIINIDVVSGTMALSVFIDLYWTDIFINWDPKFTGGTDFLEWSNLSQFWIPDIQLYNAVGRYSTMIYSPSLFIDCNGSMWSSNIAMLVFSCSYDTREFPFDQQTCVLDFGSWSYDMTELNISRAGISVSESFSYLSWEVQSKK